MVRDHGFYFPAQPRLFFDRQSCADAWKRTLCDTNGHPTWPGVIPENERVKVVKERVTVVKEKAGRAVTKVTGWMKRIFRRGDPS